MQAQATLGIISFAFWESGRGPSWLRVKAKIYKVLHNLVPCQHIYQFPCLLYCDVTISLLFLSQHQLGPSSANWVLAIPASTLLPLDTPRLSPMPDYQWLLLMCRAGNCGPLRHCFHILFTRFILPSLTDNCPLLLMVELHIVTDQFSPLHQKWWIKHWGRMRIPSTTTSWFEKEQITLT